MIEKLENRRLFTVTVTTGTDPCDSSLQAVFVNGDAASDGIVMSVGGSSIIVNGNPVAGVPSTSRVFADGGAGNDLIAFASGFVNGQGQARGGLGQDTLLVQSGAGASVMIGGADVDSIVGGTGADILIGGGGADTIDAGGGNDIVIGPITVYDDSTAANQAAMCDIQKEWTGKGSFDRHVSHLLNGGGANGTTLLRSGIEVTGDSAADDLTGGKGSTLFYASTSGAAQDLISDRRPKQIIDVVD